MVKRERKGESPPLMHMSFTGLRALDGRLVDNVPVSTCVMNSTSPNFDTVN